MKMSVLKKFYGGCVYYDEKKNKTVTLLNQQGKIGKYAAELKGKTRLTNDGQLKKDRRGRPRMLTARQRAYRIGYLNACSDSSKIFKKANANYERKTETLPASGRYGFPPKTKKGE